VLVSAEQHQKITLVGPVAADTSWQAREEHGFDKSQFSIDWQAQQVTCPQDKTSRYWIPTSDRHGKNVIHIKCEPADCNVCPSRGLCTPAKAGARMLAIHPDQAQHQALQKARLRQKAPDFKQN
jgi:transposase